MSTHKAWFIKERKASLSAHSFLLAFRIQEKAAGRLCHCMSEATDHEYSKSTCFFYHFKRHSKWYFIRIKVKDLVWMKHNSKSLIKDTKVTVVRWTSCISKILPFQKLMRTTFFVDRPSLSVCPVHIVDVLINQKHHSFIRLLFSCLQPFNLKCNV